MPGRLVNSEPLNVAIVGGGIVGLILAIGILRRDVNVKIYEQAHSFRGTGAGVAFTGNAQQCMRIIDPQIVDCLKRVATSNSDPHSPNEYLRWVDGFHEEDNDPKTTEVKLLFELYAGYEGFEGCHSAHLLDELVKLVPEGVVEFSKRVESLVGANEDESVQMTFSDGTTAEADAGKPWLIPGTYGRC